MIWKFERLCRRALLLSGAAWLLAARVEAGTFVAGADVSLLSFFETNGIAYKENGVTQDALVLLKNQGLNCVRLRLFTSSAAQAAADPYNYINNLSYTVPLAVRVKNAGLKFLLDFHYSDTWADPGHQTTPSAWTNLTFAQLVAQMRSYNSNCIAAFQAAGALPDYVQVGNEIIGGMLWPSGAVPGSDASVQWSQLAQLINAATQGIRDAAPSNPPQIVIHIDRGGDWGGTQWFFDNLIQAQHVQFDIIGQSYYPFFQGAFTNLGRCLTNTALRYGKPIFVAETGYPWTNSFWTNAYQFPSTTNGQAQYTVALVQLVKNLPQTLGAGIFWWGAEYQKLHGVNESGFYTASFFNSQGNLLPTAAVLGESVAPVFLNALLNGTNLNLQWPLSGAGMSLVTASNVAPVAWSRVTNSVQTTGTAFRVTLPLDVRPNHFYRLQAN